MITPTIFYTLQCDRCKEMFESPEGFIGQVDSYSVWEDAENSDWIEYEGKHYCPDCYHFDEEEDEYIPLPNYPKSIFEIEKFLKTYVGNRYATVREYSKDFLVSVHLRSNEQLQKEYLEMMDAFPVLWFTEKGYTTDEDEAVYNMSLCFQIRKNEGWWQAAYISIRDGDIEKISKRYTEVIDAVFNIFFWICKNRIIV